MYQDVSNEDLRTRETEYVTAVREIVPPHASEERVHEHDGGYYVKIPECLSEETEGEREEAESPIRKMVTSLMDEPHASCATPLWPFSLDGCAAH